MKSLAALVLFGVSFCVMAESDPVPNFAEDTLTGDWGGTRTAWHKKGVELNFGYKGDWLRSTGGTKKDSHYMWLGEAKLKLNAEKLWGWSGTTAYFNIQTAHGGKLNLDSGSIMGVSNVEVPVSTTKFFHAWVAKEFIDGKLAVLAGLYPVDSEFQVVDSAGLFLNPSYGPTADFYSVSVANGANGRGPSIFNTSSIGIRLKYQPNPAFYAQLAINDGEPGSPDKNTNTHINFKKGDGSLVITELGFRPSELGFLKSGDKFEGVSKVALGYWRYNPKFDDWLDGTRKRNHGAYFLAEQTLLPGFSVFVRHGTASKDVNQLKSSSSIGLNFKGLIPGRGEDVLGLATTRARASEKYRMSAGAPANADSHEQVLELTYRVQIAPWVALQPNFQRITNPGLNPVLKDVRVSGARVEIAF